MEMTNYILGTVWFIFAVLFLYSFIRQAYVSRDSKFMVLQAVGFMILTAGSALFVVDIVFIKPQSLRYLSLAVSTLAFCIYLVARINLRKATDGLQRISFSDTLFLFKPDRFYFFGVFITMFMLISYCLLHRYLHQMRADWIDVMTMGGLSLGFANLSLGGSFYHRKRGAPAETPKKMEMPLLRDDMATVQIYSALTKSIVTEIQRITGERIIRDILEEYFDNHPIPFEGCKVQAGSGVDFSPMAVNVQRITKSERTRVVGKIFRELVSKLVELHSKIASPVVAETVLKRVCLSLERQYGHTPVFCEILRELPEGFLEEEKLVLLSREELEAKVGERTTQLEDALKRAEGAAESLRVSRSSFNNIVERSADGIMIVDRNGIIRFVNSALESLLGRARDKLLSETFDVSIAVDGPTEVTIFDKCHQPAVGELRVAETEWEGESAYLATLQDITCRKHAEEELERYRENLEDLVAERTVELTSANEQLRKEIIQRKQAEDALRQSEEAIRQLQKMEAVGRLAGGVAHDFNNILTTIQGYTELALAKLTPNNPLQSDLQEVLRGADRAAKLTQQLLTFSRRQILEPKTINLNTVLLDIDKMLRRLIGEDIELVTLPADDLTHVKADPGQIEQLIVNLVVNARDAMPGGGKLTLETANISLERGHVSQHDVTILPGDYVSLTVSDTGIGMTKEVKEHLFEPFFTTKGIGKGTGLGLATCYGIVKQSGGYISVSTDVDQGTSFKIYLPVIQGEAETHTTHDESRSAPKGKETVLVVEDEPSVRSVATRILRKQGYAVLEAANGEEALHLVREHDGNGIDLLLTDVVMPQIGGRVLAARMRKERPNVKVLFTSGYPDDSIVHQGVLDSDVTFLQKPFSPATLARRVRQVLDSD